MPDNTSEAAGVQYSTGRTPDTSYTPPRQTAVKPEKSTFFAYKWGYGFIREAPQLAQRERLSAMSNRIGLAILIFILIELLTVYIIPNIMGALGMNIRFDGYSQKIYGGHGECSLYALLATAVKFGAAAAVLFSDRSFGHKMKKYLRRQPARELVPLEFFTTLALAACSQMFVVFAAKLIPSLGISTYQDNSVRYFGNGGQLVTAAFFSVVLIPIFTELLVHGALLFSLKCFGTNFAIFAAALSAVLIEHNHRTMIFTFAAAVIFGYFASVTRTVYVPMLMHVGYSALSFTIELMNDYISKPYSQLFIYSLVMAAAVLGLVMLSISLTRSKQRLETEHSLVRLRDMITIFMTSPLLLMAAGVAFVMLLA